MADWDWVREESPRWSEHKRTAFGADGPQTFGLGSPAEGDLLADEWWRVEHDGEPVGYGRLDSLWGDAEILLAVATGHRGRGVGEFILSMLEAEAGRRGLNYLYNTVRPGHPDRERVTAWLTGHGFTDRGDGELRKHVPAATPAEG